MRHLLILLKNNNSIYPHPAPYLWTMLRSGVKGERGIDVVTQGYERLHVFLQLQIVGYLQFPHKKREKLGVSQTFLARIVD